MKQILKPFSLLLTLSSILFSCTKEETTIEFPVTAITVSNLPADTVLGINAVTGMPFSAGKYTFYSLENILFLNFLYKGTLFTTTEGLIVN